MVAATILLGRALQPVEQLIGGWKALRRCARRVAAAAANAPVDAADGATLRLPAPRGRLDVERVGLRLDAQRPAADQGHRASRSRAGESLGIIGPSASGKTTLIRLMLGIWKPQAGAVRLDGADIAHWDRDALGRHVGYLPQDVELFAGTVAREHRAPRRGRFGSASSPRRSWRMRTT